MSGTGFRMKAEVQEREWRKGKWDGKYSLPWFLANACENANGRVYLKFELSTFVHVLEDYMNNLLEDRSVERPPMSCSLWWRCRFVCITWGLLHSFGGNVIHVATFFPSCFGHIYCRTGLGQGPRGLRQQGSLEECESDSLLAQGMKRQLAGFDWLHVEM
ncbi:unnamed protein product [Ectocarpus sp. 12 AP-2014]